MKLLKRIELGILVCLFFISTFLVVLAQGGRTSAQTAPFTAEFVNRSTVLVTSSDGQEATLTDPDWDDEWEYTGTYGGGCDVILDGFGGDVEVGFDENWSASQAQVNLYVELDTGTGCDE